MSYPLWVFSLAWFYQYILGLKVYEHKESNVLYYRLKGQCFYKEITWSAGCITSSGVNIHHSGGKKWLEDCVAYKNFQFGNRIYVRRGDNFTESFKPLLGKES